MRHGTSFRGQHWVHIVGTLVVLSLVGCSSSQGERLSPALRGVAVEPELRPVTATAEPAACRPRFVRPIPEVIARPRPFRLPDVIDTASGAAAPVTMQPVTGAPAGVRLVAAEATVAPRPLPTRETAAV
ncbi:MAG: hypothetical protein EBR23_08315, partial [Planctomycetia bacterium]|nr:hypothetical protein [Planctomycetia bacterium]